MSRYIDADKLKERTMMLGLEQGKVEFAVFLCKYIDTEPPADVVPKSKVEKLKIEALKITNEKMYAAIEATKAEVATEIFEEIDDAMIDHARGDTTDHWLFVRIAELKKKYTEVPTDEV